MALEGFVDWRVEDVLCGVGGAPGLERVDVVQPVSFAVMVALAELWRSFGVEPGVVVGHSQGEIAAACVAGGLSLVDGARVVVLRSRLLGEVLSGRGGMVSVALGVERVVERLAGWGGRLGVAAVNGPSAVVVSGEAGALDEFLVGCEGDGVWARRVAVDYASHSVAVEELRESLVEALAGIEPVSCGVPFFSTATGGLLDTALLDGGYWYRSLRERVRFEEAVRALAGETNAFVEVSPHPVLSVAVGETLEDLGVEGRVGVVGSLRRGEGGMQRFVRSLAEAWVCGVPVDWGSFFAGSGARRVGLPTYAFQRERFWLAPRTGVGDVSGAGLGVSDHPLLGAAVQVAGGEGWLFTGRLSLDTQAWLADHAVLDTVLLPGTGFLELVLAAGRAVGCEVVEELTLQAPLVLTKGVAVQLQVAVGEPDEDGRRQVAVYSRPQTQVADGLGDGRQGEVGAGLEGGRWARHASGSLLAESDPATQERVAGLVAELGSQWPPAGAEELDVEFLYDRLSEAGFGYGPVFQGVRAAWRRDGEIYAEVALEDDAAAEASRFEIHPALLDAGLHSLFLLGGAEGSDLGGVVLPFSLGGVSLCHEGASSLRVCLTRVPAVGGATDTGEGEAISLAAFDEAGELVVSVDSLAVRPLDASQLRGGREEGGSLLRTAWVEVPAPVPTGADEQPSAAILDGLDGALAGGECEHYADLEGLVRAVADGAGVPGVVFVSAGEAAGVDGIAEAVRVGVRGVMGLLQGWLAQEALVDSRLVFVTRGAVAVGQGEVPDLVGASVWGLLRSAQSEHPDRFVIVDLDGAETVDLVGLLRLGEPQLAVRGGCVFVPRLERVTVEPGGVPGWDVDGTVLVTGGTGVLGALVARHLAGVHGVRRLLLASRSGMGAEGASELLDELATLGCEANIAACDVCDRDQVRELIELVSPEYPLTAVVHAAGAVRDGVIEALTDEQVEEVLAPKVDAALHLHELTEDLGLAEFVLFSSAAGVLGGAGQGNYAAANAFLDALAQVRRARGLAGQSLAWGLWEQASGLTEGLGEAGRARVGRMGIAALSSERALELFDGGRSVDEALLVAARLDWAALRAQARVGVLPGLLSGLVRVAARRERGGSLARRLASVPAGEWDALILDVVRGQAAAVLGHESAGSVDPERAFKELGFDSLGAVELRNRLTQVTGVRLPATLVFDHPSCAAVAKLLRSRLEGVERGAGVVARRSASIDEPIAIVGMSCRYPGPARTPQELWELVAKGGDAISGFPADRGWDLEGLYDPDPDRVGKSYARDGGFLDDAGDFDAGFFGISPREALAMDPQQRLLLEAAWEALEDAGIDPASLRGSQTGVFAGVIPSDYGLADGAGSASAQAEGFLMFGSAGSVVSGRVSYTFGFEGPAVSVDTACSSSLVALHLACQAVRGGECSLALAGGVTVLSSPRVYLGFSRQRGLSRDGRCKSFSASADGAGFSDGAGLLVVERLSDAQRLGHRVLGVVRGSAVNQDGASNGLSAPNGPSQERVIRGALADAGLSAGEVDAVEAHGTGTTLGDPIEAQALLATYGQGRESGPLWLGSIKSNIGHSQAAAGVAGVIKMVKAFEHELLPPTLHVDEPSPQVDWSAGEVALLTESQPWPATERPRRAGVSSFGASGTNAHVIIEEPPRAKQSLAVIPATAGDGAEGMSAGGWGCGVVPLLVSGRGGAGLCGQAGRLGEFLLEGGFGVGGADGGVGVGVGVGVGGGLLDVAWSLVDGRALFGDRGVVLGVDGGGLVEGLGVLAGGGVGGGVVRGVAGGGRPVFVFPGHGAQWEGMAVGLLDSSVVFADALRVCGVALEGLVDWRVEDVLRGVGGAPGLGREDVVQPVLFAVMVALAELWRSFGVEPGVVVGHSLGEITAACVAGGLSLGDAARVVVLRSRLLGEVLSGRGGMVSVALGLGRVEELLEGWGGRLGVAGVNGPSAVVVSGELGALGEFLAVCEGDGVWARRVAIDYASHSAAVEELREPLVEALRGIEPVSCGVPFFSTAMGGFVDTAELDGEYWYRSLRGRVRFEEAVRALAGDASAFVEVSPHSVFGGVVGETLEDLGVEGRVGVVGSLRRGEGGMGRFVRSLAEAWVCGVPVDWRCFFAGSGARRVDLPSYAFQRERYWLVPRVGVGDVRGAGLGVSDHPLLGAAVQVAGGEGWLFTGRLSLDSQGWLADHAVLDTVLLPGTGFLELVLAAGSAVGCGVVEELMLQAPLVFARGVAVQVQVSVGEPDGDGRRRVVVYSRPQDDVEGGRGQGEAGGGSEGEIGAGGLGGAGGWTRHASGTLVESEAAIGEAAGLVGEAAGLVVGLGSQWPPAGSQELDVEFLYDRLSEAGFGYGPVFQGVQAAWRKDGEVYAEVALEGDAEEEAARFGIHPALLDAALHGLFLLEEADGSDLGGVALPFALGGVSLRREGLSLLRVRLGRVVGSDSARSGGGSEVRLAAFDEAGELVVSVGSLALRPLETAQLRGGREEGGSLLKTAWVEQPVAGAPSALTVMGEQLGAAILGDLEGLEGGLAGGLAGGECERYADLEGLVGAVADGAGVPGVVFVSVEEAAGAGVVGGVAGAVRAGVQGVLGLLRGWLARPELVDSRLVFVTRGAVAVGDGEVPDLVGASVWGLLRSAQSEHPDRFVIVDLEGVGGVGGSGEAGGVGSDGVVGGVGLVGLLGSSESQLAVRGGCVFVPRLERVVVEPGGVPGWGVDGTVLVTGGTGALGALVARHLAGEHGVARLLLASRSGMQAQGASELVGELAGLGCEASVVACDVCDRDQVRELIELVSPEFPLTGVVHTAGVVRDGMIEALSGEQLEEVLAPKVDAALHLHELTKDLGLSEFVLFSSAAGVVGGAGQGNYAAANAFLDALAQVRRAGGLAGVSLAWGLWEQASGLTEGLGEAGRARIARQGIAALSSEQALGLLDEGRGTGEGSLVAARLDLAGLRAQARVGVLPALLSGLVRVPARRQRGGTGGSLARRLAGIPESEWDAVVLEVVRGQAAAILGHESASAVDPERAFKELGFDSLGAVELRNRLTQATGVRLPATLVFDYPNCAAIAGLLRSLIDSQNQSQAHATGVPARKHTSNDEPIAIVGMSCRYPGSAHTPQQLWELVAQGKDAITGFPTNRGWDLEALYDPDLARPGTSYTRDGGFLDDAGDFDADFFGISPREALAMDPQQRLLLEGAWEALERAGIDPTSLRGSQTGVFAGVMHSAYGAAASHGSPNDETDDHLMIGSMDSAVSGRVAYTFGFEGPAVSVDTACSSSLVALHLACQALRQGECSLALAGGVAVLCDRRVFVWFSRQRGLSRDGRCKSFSASADGVGFSDGVGLLVVERLSDARRLGHRVLGVVRGSAINQDGASNGLTAPNGPSQERVIRRALAGAGLEPDEVDVVEAHGTGTTLGDPIEAQALLATYGQGRESGPLWLGSIKSNIGHSQAAAGVAGVIKMVKAFEHELLPPTLHVDAPSPQVDWSAGEVALLTEPQPWPATERPRRAGVSSFGMSGTNAHVIIEEPPRVEELLVESPVAAGGETALGVAAEAERGEVTVSAGGWGCGVVPLLVSGRGGAGLCGQAGRLGEFLLEGGFGVGGADGGVGVGVGVGVGGGLLDVAWSLVDGRALFGDRGVVLGVDGGGLVEGLGVLAGGGVGGGVVRGVAGGGRPVFVFPGHGAQWEGMAVGLLDSSVVFADALRVCGVALEGLVDWRVEDVLRGVGGAPGLGREDVVQPVLFAVMVALAELWRSFGVEPGVVVGHSLGEITAACVAGGLSLGDAARVVVLRSRLLGEVLSGRGGMVSVALGLGRVEELLEGWGGRLGVAGVNGPSAVVVSGELGALGEFLAVCEGDGVWARRVAIDYASHSAAVEELREPLVEALRGIEPVSCGVPFFSTAMGGFVDTAELDGEYWYRSLRGRVRFEEAVRALAGDASAFVEVSPHSVFGGVVGETLEDLGVEGRVGVVGSLRRGEGGMGRFVRSLAEAWVCGVPVDWRCFFAGSGARRVDLPSYAFQRERYWLVPRVGVGDVRGAGLGVSDHPLLGAAVQVAGGEGWLFTGRLSLDSQGWLADHAVLDTVLLPGTGFLELVLAAGSAVGCGVVEELMLQAPLVFARGVAVQVQVSVGEPDGDGRRRVVVYSRPQDDVEGGRGQGEAGGGSEGEIGAGGLGGAGGWTRHASGTLVESEAAIGEAAGLVGEAAGLVVGLGSQWPPAGSQELDVEFLYDRLSEAGFGYGPVFQGVQAAWRKDGEVYAEVALEGDAEEEAARFGIHPALLDAALHGLFLLEEADGSDLGGVALPFALGGVSLRREGLSLLRVRLGRVVGSDSARSGGGSEVRLAAFDEAGELVVSVGSLALRPLETAQLRGGREEGGSLLKTAWVEQPVAGAPSALTVMGEQLGAAILGDLEGLEGGLAGGLAGGECERYADLEGLVGAVADGAGVPGVVFVSVEEAAGAGVVGGVAGAVRAGVQGVLGLLRGWLARPELVDSRLVFVTRGAVAVGDGEVPDLVGASVWGLLRSAQSEHPDRFVIVDLEGVGGVGGSGEAGGVGSDGVVGGVGLVGLLGSSESQLAVRGGCVFVPRLERVVVEPGGVPGWGVDGTVLVTGGTGALGALVARHLAGEHGVARLLLASRSGMQAQGASELVGELAGLGCEASVVACDVCDRDQVRELIELVSPEFPLTGVVHTAGVVRDGMIEALSGEQLEEVLAPKVDAALHLHELTKDLGLSEFVLFSSAAGVVGGAGQGNYAAANAFLDALAQVRRAGGLAGVSLAWGLWEQASGLTEGLGEAGRARIARQGIAALSSEQALGLLDEGRGTGEGSLVAARLDLAGLRAQARVGVLPALLSGLVRVPARRQRGGTGGSLARRLAGIPESEWDAVVLEVVRGQAAAILGHESASAVDPERAFKELGFDSLGAVELRNRLTQATGVRLPATLVFDYPNCAAIAGLLRSLIDSQNQSQAHATGVPARKHTSNDEPIAIVGMSCRYPGSAHTPQQLWELVAQGKDAITGFPTNRGWDLERLYDIDPDRPGKSYVRDGGFLDDAGDFDADFFGISPREALAMDPQQRLLLEGAWEALEDAGIDPASLRGSQTGVFAGVIPSDYGLSIGVGSGSAGEQAEGYMLLGSAGSVVSGRVSYTFGFEGPAVSVDTACSSSLVALHLACQALRGGECSLALAGGVTVLFSPRVYVGFSRQRGLSRDGRCKSFAAAADGAGFSDGAGLLVVERLSDALRLGHRVLAVVRGSAVNQDGASNGLSAPNGPSQERVIRGALADAGLSAGEVDVVEAHGTGTTLGDPIEAQALLGTYGQGRESGPLWLGSIKSNIGHSQAAAGVAGVIKMVKAFEHELLPPTLHVDAPSPQVDWSAGEVALLTEPQPWPATERPRRAGVSSFGLSGTNAHVIIEEPPRVQEPLVESPVAAGGEAVLGAAPGVVGGMAGSGVVAGGWGCGVVPLLVSGRGGAGLCGQAGRLGEFLLEGGADSDGVGVGVGAGGGGGAGAGAVGVDGGVGIGGGGLLDVAFSLVEGRAVFEDRGVVLGGGRGELVRGLEVLAGGEAGEGVVRGVAREGRTVFVFPGQGAQWEGMARELLDSSAVFGESLRACEEAFAGLVDWRIEDVLRGAGGAPGLERVDVVQPVSFAVMVSLAALWRSFGVLPGAVVGHSQGEIAAAYVAGGLSLEDAARVVVLRSRLLGEVLSGRGGMVSVALGVDRVRERVAGWGERLSVAAVNGPSAVVVSGETGALDEFLVACEGDEVWARRVAVDYASHSAAVEELRDDLLDALGGLEPVSSGVPFCSAATGDFFDTSGLDGAYWYRSLRERVRFEEAVRVLAGDACAFVEVSPHPVLSVAVGETLEDLGVEGRVGVVGSLRRGEGGMGRFVRSLAEAWVCGVPVDWGSFFAGSGARRVGLPTYAFQRERYWLTVGVGVGDASGMGLGAADHPLLGAAVQVAGGEGWLFTGRLSLDSQAWLADHAVLDTVLLPGTGFLELVLAAGRATGCEVVEELLLQAPLVLTKGVAVQLQVVVGGPEEDGRREVTVYSRPQTQAAPQSEARAGRQAGADGQNGTGWQSEADQSEAGGWTRHASGTLLIESDTATQERTAASIARLGSQWPPAGAEELDVEFLYDRLSEAGFEYGPVFQGVRAAWHKDGEIYAEVALEQDTAHEATRYGIHPALLDAALHTGLQEWREELAPGGQALPFSLSGVTLHNSGTSSLRVHLTREGSTLSLVAFDGAGEPALTVDSLAVRPIEAGLLKRGHRRGYESLHRLQWSEVPIPPVAGGQPQRFALLGELELAGIEGERHVDLWALIEALEAGAPAPNVVFAVAPVGGAGDVAQAARATTQQMLELLQTWLAHPDLEEVQLVLLTSGAVAIDETEAPDLLAASLWGLLRTAQSEHPGHFQIVDRDPAAVDSASGGGGVGWLELLDAGEPQLALRGDRAYAPRLMALEGPGTLLAPTGEERWHLGVGRGGTLDDLALMASPPAYAPLGAGQVRVAVHAGGLNFRDVLIALGLYPGEEVIGSEGAGVVLEVGEGVDDLAPGDRVMGLVQESFGPVAVTYRELVVPLPEGWSFVQGAAVPIVYLTAYYALVDLAGLQRGESLLVHAATGGVGTAALQIARHLGAEVFATASPAKAAVLSELGLDAEHIGSSRDLDFEQRFLHASEGKGMNVVLNALAREFTDASLRLLPQGGRFVEMGKTDLRDAEQIAEEHTGVRYRAFDLIEAGPARIQQMLQELLVLFDRGVLTHAPIATWDVRRGVEAFRFLREARHIGKIVLTIPQPADPEGTVLITGGTGRLGALVAHRLAAVRGVRHLLLTSRGGPDAEGASELVAELAELGCEARVVACDVADREQAAELLASIPAEHPLVSVIHAAGVLDDGLLESLSAEQVERVMRPKVDGALNLHELTEDLGLAEFALFSSAAGLFGTPGQGNYAAANAFLDALAQVRQARGLAGQSLAWGLWEQTSGMTGGLGEAGRARIARQGFLTFANGPELFDVARGTTHALVLPVRLDMAALRAQAGAGTLPALLREMVRRTANRERGVAGSLARQLAGVPEAERETVVRQLVLAQAASVLGHDSPHAIDAQRAFKELGFDSLGAVELRNRLAQATGLRLPSTLIFDYPNSAAVAGYLIRKVVPEADTEKSKGTGTSTGTGELDIRRLLASIPIVRLLESGLYEQLVKLAGGAHAGSSPTVDDHAAIDEMDADTLVRMALGADGSAEQTGGQE